MSTTDCLNCILILPTCSVCASDSTCLIRLQTCRSCASASCVPNSQISPEVLSAAVDGTATTTATGDVTLPFPTGTSTTVTSSFSSLTSLIGNSSTTVVPFPSNNLTMSSTLTVTASLPNSSSVTTTVVVPDSSTSSMMSSTSSTSPTPTGAAGPSLYGMASGTQGLALSVLALWAAVGMIGGRRFRL